MERKPEKKKYSGWERKRLKEVSDRQQSSSKCIKLDTYFSSCTPLTATTIQPEVDVSQDTQVQNVQATSSQMHNQGFETQDNKGLAFRGHRESQGLGESTLNEGNFLELIKLISKKDDLLKQHLLFGDRNATYLSPDAVSSNIQTQLFFGVLESIYTFFTGSLPRLSILQEGQRNNIEAFSLTLKRLSDTRWASRKTAVDSILQNLPALVLALRRIVDGEVKNSTSKQIAVGKGILVTIETFEFLVVLMFWKRILHKAFNVSIYLQKSSIDMLTAFRLIQIFENEMSSWRNEFESEFEQIENEATELAEKCDIRTEYKQHRLYKRKIFHDKGAEDTQISDSRKKFIVQTYLVSLDSDITSTNTSFQNFKDVSSKFCCLDPKHFALDDCLIQLQQLAVTYSDVVDSVTEVVQEFVSFRTFYQEVFSVSSVNKGVSTEKEPPEIAVTVNSILKFMIANDLCSMYPNLATLYRIFLTLPISSAGAERSFSRLKLLKTYIRSTMNEDRLSSLALITIERQLASDVDLKDVIDHFAKMKPRRKRML
ncbi:uncharacterized protein LOC131928846 [Physella acuta]|uniref:uncharacterized protein LOC131928846 n=1 Tax=Physella acuta TaxID=109671 RepID=UPI0027DB9B18|nr:uncharacterized protein LOC131928846 [Physella acuta]